MLRFIGAAVQKGADRDADWSFDWICHHDRRFTDVGSYVRRQQQWSRVGMLGPK